METQTAVTRTDNLTSDSPASAAPAAPQAEAGEASQNLLNTSSGVSAESLMTRPAEPSLCSPKTRVTPGLKADPAPSGFRESLARRLEDLTGYRQAAAAPLVAAGLLITFGGAVSGDLSRALTGFAVSALGTIIAGRGIEIARAVTRILRQTGAKTRNQA